MLTEAYLEPNQTSAMEHFSLRLSHILKMYLIRSNCLCVPFFTQLTLSWKILQLWKCREKNCFVNKGTIFFFQNSKLCNGMAPSVNKSSHSRCSIRKGVLRNSAKFTGKHLYHSDFLIKKGLWHSCFLVNFAKVLRTPFSQNPSGDCFGIKVF